MVHTTMKNYVVIKRNELESCFFTRWLTFQVKRRLQRNVYSIIQSHCVRALRQAICMHLCLEYLWELGKLEKDVFTHFINIIYSPECRLVSKPFISYWRYSKLFTCLLPTSLLVPSIPFPVLFFHCAYHLWYNVCWLI